MFFVFFGIVVFCTACYDSSLKTIQANEKKWDEINKKNKKNK